MWWNKKPRIWKWMFKSQSCFQITLEIFWRNLIREINNLIKCQVFLSSLNRTMQLRDCILIGLETLPLNLLTRAGNNKMNFVLGVLNKKRRGRGFKQNIFRTKRRYDQWLGYPPHKSGGTNRGDDPKLQQEVDRDCDWQFSNHYYILINVIQKSYFPEFKVYLPRQGF